jgi:hypothetical protein
VKAPGVKAAATETAAMRLGSSSGDHGSEGNHNNGCAVFDNLRVMQPSFHIRHPIHYRIQGMYERAGRDCHAKKR